MLLKRPLFEQAEKAYQLPTLSSKHTSIFEWEHSRFWYAGVTKNIFSNAIPDLENSEKSRNGICSFSENENHSKNEKPAADSWFLTQ